MKRFYNIVPWSSSAYARVDISNRLFFFLLCCGTGQLRSSSSLQSGGILSSSSSKLKDILDPISTFDPPGFETETSWLSFIKTSSFDLQRDYGANEASKPWPLDLRVMLLTAVPPISVTRFGEILPLGQKIKNYLAISWVTIWQNFEPTLANILYFWPNIHCSKWPNIEQIKYPSGANSIKLYGSVNYGFVVTAKFWP